MKWLANALSISRAVPLAPLIVLTAAYGYWAAGFWILALGALTDALDGWAARRFGSETQAGKDWIDPLCDAALAAGAFIGLIWGQNWAWLFMAWGTPMMALGIIMKALKQGNGRGRWVANWLLPMCEWGTFYFFGYLYAHRAYGDAVTLPWWIGTVTIVPVIVYLKWSRVRDWFAVRR